VVWRRSRPASSKNESLRQQRSCARWVFPQPAKRNVLSTKEWGGKKIIWEAYDEATQVEKRLKRQVTSKYADSSRAALRARITELEAKLLSLQTELDVTRERQYDELCVLWARNTPLHKVLD